MSLGARAPKGGAKGKEGKAQEKGRGGEKTQPKEKVKPQVGIIKDLIVFFLAQATIESS